MKNNLAKYIGVEEGQAFTFDAWVTKYRVCNNTLQLFDPNTGYWCESSMGIGLLSERIESGITILPIYSVDTHKAAFHDSFRFKYVARDDNGSIMLFTERPSFDNNSNVVWFQILRDDEHEPYNLPPTDYPEVKPGQCVKLAEIVGGEH